MTAEQFAMLAAFLDAREQKHVPLISFNLPSPTSIGPGLRTITLRVETLDRFRAHFAELHTFACAVCDVPVKDLCLAHLANYLGLLSVPSDEDPGVRP